MYIATKWVQFSFNNTMYKQIDVIAVGSPFGSAMANPFGGFQEKSFVELLTNHFIMHGMLTTHLLRSPRDQREQTIFSFNHPALKFTCEFENNCLLFLT